MLTEVEYRLLKSCFYIISISQTFPFSWSKNGFKKMDTRRGILQKLGGWLNIGSCLAHLIYAIVRLIPGFGYTPEEFRSVHYSVLLNGIMVLAFSIGLALQLAAIYKADELATLGNQLLHFNQAIGKSYLGSGEFAKSNMREKVFVGVAAYLLILGCVFLPGIIFIAPENKYSLFSVLPEHWKSVATLILTVLLEAGAWSRVILLHFFVLYSGHAYITTNNFWLDKICSEWIISGHIHIQRRAVGMYRILTHLNTLYNNGTGSALFPILKTACEIGAICCLFAVIRFHGSIIWFVYAYFVAGFIFCAGECVGAITYMATVNEKSLEVQHAFRRSPKLAGRADVKASLASCRPLFCRISSLFFVDRNTKLIYMSLLSNILIQVLLGSTGAKNSKK